MTFDDLMIYLIENYVNNEIESIYNSNTLQDAEESLKSWRIYRDRYQKSLDRAKNPESKKRFLSEIQDANKEIQKAKETIDNLKFLESLDINDYCKIYQCIQENSNLVEKIHNTIYENLYFYKKNRGNE